MGKRGPPRTPTPTLANRGSWLAVHRGNDPTPSTSLPPCPKWVSAKAAEHWDDLGAMLLGMGLMSEGYTLALGLLVEALADYIRRAEQCETTPEVTETENGAFAHPIFGMKDKAWDRVLKAAQQFGLTPATISQVTIDKAKEEKTSDYRLA